LAIAGIVLGAIAVGLALLGFFILADTATDLEGELENLGV
jgi:hypothetical protein